MNDTTVPVELDAAFRDLAGAMNRLWPIAVEHMRVQSPERHAELSRYLTGTEAAWRCVVVTRPALLLQFELLDDDSAWIAFYRIEGK